MVQKIFDLFQINFRSNVEYITLIFFFKKFSTWNMKKSIENYISENSKNNLNYHQLIIHL